MKLKLQALAFAGTLVLAGAAQAQEECSRPPEPDIPDGASASRDEMVKAQQAVQEYVKETEAYIACVNKAEKNALAEAKKNEDVKLSAKERKAYVKRHNAAVESLKRIANRFNKQLSAYQKAQQE